MAAALLKRGVAVARAGARLITVEARAVRYQRHGHPTSVLKLETIKLDTASLQPSDVFVRMLAAPITPVDLAQVAGAASTPAVGGLPRVGGNEGVGIVEEAGASSGLKKGDVVVASRGGVGTWSTHVIAPGASFTSVPGVDVTKVELEPLAASVAPLLAAKRLLDGFVQLAKGDVVVQNNAASTVGQAVTQLAAARGLRSVSLVRPTPAHNSDWAAIVGHLQGLGATLVASEEQAARHEFAATLSALPAAKLGLNSSGGAAASVIARLLAPGSTLVTFGAADRRPAITAPLDLFTARDLTLRGLNVDAWARSLSREARDAEVREGATAVANGAVRLLVAREPFMDFGAALARAYSPANARKVVLTF